jgi:hypothetical protein
MPCRSSKPPLPGDGRPGGALSEYLQHYESVTSGKGHKHLLLVVLLIVRFLDSHIDDVRHLPDSVNDRFDVLLKPFLYDPSSLRRLLPAWLRSLHYDTCSTGMPLAFQPSRRAAMRFGLLELRFRYAGLKPERAEAQLVFVPHRASVKAHHLFCTLKLSFNIYRAGDLKNARLMSYLTSSSTTYFSRFRQQNVVIYTLGRFRSFPSQNGFKVCAPSNAE